MKKFDWKGFIVELIKLALVFFAGNQTPSV